MTLLHRHPDFLTRTLVLVERLKGCTTLKELQSVLGFMIKTSVDQDCFAMNQFMTTCSTLGCWDLAASMFSQVQNPDVFLYNAMIRVSVQCSYPLQALEQYKSMLRAGVMPESHTFSSLIKGCRLVQALRYGKCVHGGVWKNGCKRDVFVQTAAIDFYASFGGIVESEKVFDEMPVSERDVFAWTTMLSAYAQAGDMASAQRLFDEMPERNNATWNTLIDGYARLGNLESAQSLFENIPDKNIISWTTMIACYAQNKLFREAVTLFRDMTNLGFSPDEVTMSTIISACAHLGSLDIGREIHYYVMQNRFHLDVYIGSALVDMYSKCGSLEKSLVVFYKLQEKNLFCWNSVIDGLAVHGFARKALMMLSKMESEKIYPNWVTFVSILNACNHAGLVEEGRRLFMRMKKDYLIVPRVEHYGCMVALFSKAGLLEDALGLIRSMESEPNAFIWGSLLDGCRVQKNLEIARICLDALILLEPNNSGHYMLLINMYAASNQWDEVTKIRRMMKGRGIEKGCPGHSWIEIGGDICQFAASDRSHPASDKICMFLNDLDEQMRLSNIKPHEISIGF
ncbi:pentatricopeptide repeat-containing protein At1g06143 [Punica granatum]|uniref:Pentatricopeptide repeat-containing protein At1g06143 n=2 Tax=Punica granatum TaxID=22663 RepID=A0A6P8D3B7_PUNGR|nr:pentatricopeptide repeat-containing protein At1g06143 [Punica granatum]